MKILLLLCVSFRLAAATTTESTPTDPAVERYVEAIRRKTPSDANVPMYAGLNPATTTTTTTTTSPNSNPLTTTAPTDCTCTVTTTTPPDSEAEKRCTKCKKEVQLIKQSIAFTESIAKYAIGELCKTQTKFSVCEESAHAVLNISIETPNLFLEETEVCSALKLCEPLPAVDACSNCIYVASKANAIAKTVMSPLQKLMINGCKMAKEVNGCVATVQAVSCVFQAVSPKDKTDIEKLCCSACNRPCPN